MADVTVSLDDAIHGRFPPVCAKTGARSDGTLVLDVPFDRPRRRLVGLPVAPAPHGPRGGPPPDAPASGATGHRRRWVRVRVRVRATVPWTECAQARVVNLRGNRDVARLTAMSAAVAVIVVVRAPIGDDPGLAMDRPAARIIAVTLVAVVLGSVAAGFAAGRRLRRAGIRITADPTGRWVTLSGVDPRFRDAVRRDQRRLGLPVP